MNMRNPNLVFMVVLGVFLLAWCQMAMAAGMERVLMPGEVVQAHAKTESTCSACHQTFNKAAQPGLCLACHKDVAADLKARRGFHGRAAAKVCRDCHTDHKGRDANIVRLDTKAFNHAQTDFSLVGAHRTAQCAGCHAAGKRYREAPSTCVGCHRDDDAHKAALGNDCARCHVANDWKQARFNHAETVFALRGKHADAKCASCHKLPRSQGKLGTDCVACHKDDDVHKGTMGQACGSCHVENAWAQARFDHGKTGYPLIGRHAQAECSGCHRQTNVFRDAPTECIACHKADDRHAGTLGKDCAACHQPQAWTPSRGFDHSRTAFPLAGKHRAAACLGCHKGPTQFRGVAKACVDCHRQDDSHKGRNGSDCGSCHDAGSWKNATFDHARMTRFALSGSHGRLACAGCHKGDLHRDKLDMSCASCHRGKDPHAGTLGESCENCHNTEQWIQVQVDHDRTAFPLIGQHRAVQCKGCHEGQKFKDAPVACAGCHAKDDKHRGRLGNDCGACHSPRDWRLWEFDHGKTTKFPLQGAHASLLCESCHTNPNGLHVGLSTVCGSCHAGDDAHDGSFGMRCERCHTSASFKEVHAAEAGQ